MHFNNDNNYFTSSCLSFCQVLFGNTVTLNTIFISCEDARGELQINTL